MNIVLFQHKLLVGLLVLALASCGGDDETAGGAADLPGRVPAGTVFAEAPKDAPAAPPFRATLLDGTRVDVEVLWNERPLVLVFTASWCERCADVHREAAAAVDEHEGLIALLGLVAEDDVASAAEYAEELDLGHAVGAVPERVWLNYAAREPPVVVVVAHGGKVLRGWPGGVGRNVLAGALDGLVRHRADPQ